MLFVLLAGVIAIAIHVQPASAANTTLGFNPPTTVKHTPADSFFDVYLEIADVPSPGLFGFDINITWDNSLITYTPASEVHIPYLITVWGADDGFHWNAVNVTGGAGWFRYVAVSLGTEFTTPGTQTLLKLSFDIVNPLTNSMNQTSLHFDIHKLSDKSFQSITHTANDGIVQIWGKTPTLSLIPTKTTCRMIDEPFDVAVSVSNALSLRSLTFDIRYDTLLLDFVSVTWGVWSSGTEDHTTLDGIVTGSTSGIAQDGTQVLLTIRFKAAYDHIWKDEATIVPTWYNVVTGSISIESATLGYPNPQPNLTYTNGGGSGNTIIYGGDVNYSWSPIRGDVNLDGTVTVDDVRIIAIYYDTYNDTWNLTGSDSLVDIFDLVVVASNFGFVYAP